jgi:hypothetical protein
MHGHQKESVRAVALRIDLSRVAVTKQLGAGDQPLSEALKDALAPDSAQGIQPLDAYGHPAVNLAQI